MAITGFIIESSIQRGGQKKNLLVRWTDDVDGRSWTQAQRLPTSVDNAVWLQAQSAKKEERLKQRELDQAIDLIRDGKNPVQVVNNGVRVTKKQLTRQLIRWMMQGADPERVLLMEPLILNLRSKYTDAQLETLLGVNAEKMQRINRKVNHVLNNKDAFEGVINETDEDF